MSGLSWSSITWLWYLFLQSQQSALLDLNYLLYKDWRLHRLWVRVYKQDRITDYLCFCSHSQSNVIVTEKHVVQTRVMQDMVWHTKNHPSSEAEALCTMITELTENVSYDLTQNWRALTCLRESGLLISYSYKKRTTQVLADGREVKRVSIRSFLYDGISREKIKLKHSFN